jgi:hypothetical protein
MEPFAPKTVRHAAVFLDRNLPAWETHINDAELNMCSPYSCILGQLWRKHPVLRHRMVVEANPYYSALEVLGLNDAHEVFDSGPKLKNGEKWLKEISARSGQPPVRDLGWSEVKDEIATPTEPLADGQRRLTPDAAEAAYRTQDMTDAAVRDRLGDVRETLDDPIYTEREKLVLLADGFSPSADA